MHNRLKEARNAYISDYLVACIARVSSRVRQESWDESKKKGMTGEGEGNDFAHAVTRLETLATQANYLGVSY